MVVGEMKQDQEVFEELSLLKLEAAGSPILCSFPAPGPKSLTMFAPSFFILFLLDSESASVLFQ